MGMSPADGIGRSICDARRFECSALRRLGGWNGRVLIDGKECRLSRNRTFSSELSLQDQRPPLKTDISQRELHRARNHEGMILTPRPFRERWLVRPTLNG